MLEPIIGTVDLASVALYLFWLFFAMLIYYLQTENMREGYPLERDGGGPAPNQGPFPLPKPKTFRLPHGRGEVTVPDMAPEARSAALRQTSPAAGSPFEPTGDPMVDGVGPASWAPRRDAPELDGHGRPKIRPMAMLPDFHISAGVDPRGLPVVAADGAIVGRVTELWVDAPEQLVRYLGIELAPEAGGGARLAPIQLTRIKSDRVAVHSLFGRHFAGVPATAAPDQVTMLEEEKICAYYAGGKLYAAPERLGPKF